MSGFFNKLFGKEQSAELSDYSKMLVDIHSHLIPGIDDGSKSLEESIFLIRELMALGFKKIVTTPHVMPGGYDNTSAGILAGRDLIRAELIKKQIDVEFDAAAEYYYDEYLVPLVQKKDMLTIGNNFVLVEFSYLAKPSGTGELIYNMQLNSYKMILAHPERYPFYHEKHFESYKDFKDKGIYFQINIGSLLGKYGKNAKTVAEKLIDENMVEFAGSDLHNDKILPVLKDCLKTKHLDKLFNSKDFLNRTLIN